MRRNFMIFLKILRSRFFRVAVCVILEVSQQISLENARLGLFKGMVAELMKVFAPMF